MNAARTAGTTGPGRADASLRFLTAITALMAVLGLGLAAWPLLDSLNPSAEVMVKHAVDLSDIPPGARRTVYWKKYPIFIAHRTPAEIAQARSDDQAFRWSGQFDRVRVQRDEWLIVIGLSPMNDCLLSGQRPGDYRGGMAGWYNRCSGESFDTSGRSWQWRIEGRDHYYHLPVPPYRFISDTEIEFDACFPYRC